MLLPPDVWNIVDKYIDLSDYINLHSTCKALWKLAIQYHDKTLLFRIAMVGSYADKVALLLPLVNAAKITFKLTPSQVETIEPLLDGNTNNGEDLLVFQEEEISPLLYAIAKGDIEIALLLMDDPALQYWCDEAKEQETNLFELPCTLGYAELVQKLLSFENIDYLSCDDALIGTTAAINNNHFDVFQVLMADPRIMPHNVQWNGGQFVSFDWNIFIACEEGRTRMVSILLADERVNPINTGCGRCLRVACKNGHLEVVKMLLEDSRNIDPSAFDNEAIKAALQNQHSEIVDFLLGDQRVSSSFTPQ